MRELIQEHRTTIQLAAYAGLLFAVCFTVAGCAGLPQWLTEGETIVGLLITSGLSVVGLIGTLTGNPALAAVAAALSSWAAKVTAALQNIETLVEQYKTTPGESLLQEIQEAIALAQADVPAFGAIVGIPASTQSTIEAWAQLLSSQLAAWAAIFPPVSAALADGHTALPALRATLAESGARPLNAGEVKAGYNKILDTKTGDPAWDAALAAAKRL